MKKASTLLYKIGFILDLVLALGGVVLFVVAAMGKVNSGFIALGIAAFVLYGLGGLMGSAAAGDTVSKPNWKRPHIFLLVYSFFAFNPIMIIAAILALLESSKAEGLIIDVNDPLSLLHLNKRERFILGFSGFFMAIPGFFKKVGLAIGRFFKKLGIGIFNFFKNIVLYFVKGSWKTRLSYVVMGFSNFANRQILRGVLFFLMEVVFVFYMVFVGGNFFSKLGTLGTVATHTESQEVFPGSGIYEDVTILGDNSFRILLYGVLTIFFLIAFIYTWYLNVRQAHTLDLMHENEKKIAHDKDDIHALVDQDFYKTLLALPLIGIVVFTIMPIFFMILVAFTNYDTTHQPPNKLFTWMGTTNFAQLFTWTSGEGGPSFSATFGEILVWTLIWAFFATFTNYFLGMMVSMLINKKGIKLKKLWRTVLVFSIAIPQFISLLYVSKMFADNGIINTAVRGAFGFTIPFWTDPMWARITVIIINIWIGIPYLMLITTGILMNIPADLYESSKIDGASPIQQYMKITLPYMLFVTGPYLLTSFTGNMNNFNVIFLLTGGAPKAVDLYGNAGRTDLLITWLYSLTVNQSNYSLASVIGIMIFIVVAVLSLIVYNLIPSTKNEEDYA